MATAELDGEIRDHAPGKERVDEVVVVGEQGGWVESRVQEWQNEQVRDANVRETSDSW